MTGMLSVIPLHVHACASLAAGHTRVRLLPTCFPRPSIHFRFSFALVLNAPKLVLPNQWHFVHTLLCDVFASLVFELLG